MSHSPKTDVKIVFGAMAIGKPNTFHARIYTSEDASKILDLFQSHGHSEVDTARVYGDGTSEGVLASVEPSLSARGIIVDTKLYPNKNWPVSENSPVYDHSPEGVRRGLEDSLAALKTDKIDMFYLHAPDRSVEFEDTLREVDKLHKEGKFTRFGISNFISYEVAKVCEICKKNNWIAPTVYQGIYNVLQRSIEAELFPCLRHYGISLYGFQPLAAGFLTGRYKRNQTEFEEGSRFDPKQAVGRMTQGRYFNETYFNALDVIQPAAEKEGLTIAEVAMRWMVHHSMLEKEKGDAVIVGASSLKHLEENLVDLEKGKLSDDMVAALEKAWLIAKPVAPKYWH